MSPVDSREIPDILESQAIDSGSRGPRARVTRAQVELSPRRELLIVEDQIHVLTGTQLESRRRRDEDA